MTVYTTVKLRPDLAVQGLTFPETAIVQQMVNIRAHIAELNADSGATTACVLGIDGNTVDQANHVYVDAGGGVTCEFSYAFSGAGMHSIDVTAANPVPGGPQQQYRLGHHHDFHRQRGTWHCSL